MRVAGSFDFVIVCAWIANVVVVLGDHAPVETVENRGGTVRWN